MVSHTLTTTRESQHQVLNKNWFNLVNMCLCTHEHTHMLVAPPWYTHTHTLTWMFITRPSRVEEYSRQCNSHPGRATLEISSRGNTRLLYCPQLLGAGSRVNSHSFIQSPCLGGNQPPFGLLLWTMHCRTKLEEKSHLNYHILRESRKYLSSLWRGILYNLAEARHYSFSCNTLTEIKRAPRSWQHIGARAW